MTASIHAQVLRRVMAALLIGGALLVGSTWWLQIHEMGEVFEDNLKQVALALAKHSGAARGAGLRLDQPLPRSFEQHGEFEFVTAAWNPQGRQTYSSNPGVSLPFVQRSGPSDITIGGERWYLYTVVLDTGVVQAAQRASDREMLARETASRLVLPVLTVLAVIALLLRLALRRGLAPLSRAAGEVATRSVEALHPIPMAAQPRELQQLTGAINDLMARLGNALAVQRHFVADAAHELRSPITALQLQLQLLERARDEAQRSAAMDELRAGIARTQHLVEQLLQLSRVGPETPALKRERVDLAQLARETVARFSARAEEQRIDLGALAGDTLVVAGDAQQLGILLDNLVDNALRHTPAGGKVDVEAVLADGRPSLRVTDSGPGISPAERERVFDRFYRSAISAATTGSGLGLAIVRAVAQRHDATVSLDDAPGGGLLVSVRFAATAAAPEPAP